MDSTEKDNHLSIYLSIYLPIYLYKLSIVSVLLFGESLVYFEFTSTNQFFKQL